MACFSFNVFKCVKPMRLNCIRRCSNLTILLQNKEPEFSSKIHKRFFITTTVYNDTPNPAKNWYTMTFQKPDGEKLTVKAKEGSNFLDIAINNDLDLDGYGACEGTLACSTCHVVFTEKDFEKLSDPPADEELDMLDLAYGLTKTSRLGCQVCLTKDLDGVVVKLPEGKSDARTL